MKPTAADLWLWEVAQSRDVPGWARELDAKRALSVFGTGTRESRIAQHIHAAVNAHGGSTRVKPSRDQRNAIALLEMVRRNNARGLNPECGNTLRGYMQKFNPDEPRAKYYRRWLRRLVRP